jgi:hypothetical protein
MIGSSASLTAEYFMFPTTPTTSYDFVGSPLRKRTERPITSAPSMNRSLNA